MTFPAKHYFDSIAFHVHAQLRAQRTIKHFLGLLQQPLPASRFLLHDVHAGVARAQGICIPSRDQKGRVPLAKCAVATLLSLRMLSSFQGQSGVSVALLLRLSFCIVRRGFRQQQVAAVRNTARLTPQTSKSSTLKLQTAFWISQIMS